MAINLSNVNISIHQFQEASSGTVNAGEVRLKNDHSLKLINHHTFLTSWNDVSISHAEVLAIKDAFVRALSDSGVDRTGVVTVRYSEPAGFPVKFNWETTIGLDGTSRPTTIVVT